jgi:hypothetical protein
MLLYRNPARFETDSAVGSKVRRRVSKVSTRRRDENDSSRRNPVSSGGAKAKNGRLAPSVGESAAAPRGVRAAGHTVGVGPGLTSQQGGGSVSASGVVRNTGPGASLRRVRGGPRTARRRAS